MLKVATRRATQSANSYADSGYADNYFTIVIGTLWNALLLEEKESALITASQYLDGHYQFVGKVKSPNQLLAWPRVGAIDSDGRLHDGIPERLKQACCELALTSALSGLDNPLTDNDFILSESKKVADIEKKVQYTDDKPASQIYPKVDALLKSLLTNSPNAYLVQLNR